MNSRFVPIIGFAVIALLSFYLLWGKSNGGDGSAKEANKPFPYVNITQLGGKQTWRQVAPLKGHVTLVNVFASWCVPCGEEVPELIALKQQFPSLQLVGIAWNDKPQDAQNWLIKHHNPFHLVFNDPAGEGSMALGLTGIPESFIVDDRGIIRFRLTGALTAQAREGEIGKVISELLGTTPMPISQQPAAKAPSPEPAEKMAAPEPSAIPVPAAPQATTVVPTTLPPPQIPQEQELTREDLKQQKLDQALADRRRRSGMLIRGANGRRH